MKTKLLLFCGFVSVSIACLQAQVDPVEFGEVEIAVSDDWVTVDLEGVYTTPIVSAGSITNNQTQAVVAQVRNVTANSFDIRLVDWGTAGLHTDVETVSFMAIEEGRHTIGGLTFQAGKKTDFSAMSVDGSSQSGYEVITFDPVVKQPDVVDAYNYTALSQVVGEGDPSAIHSRHRNTASWTDRIQVRFEQGRTDLSDVTISELHYIIIESGSGVTSSGAPFRVFSSDKIYNEDLKVLSYGGSYTDPFIYAKQPFNFGAQPANLRISNVEGDQLMMIVDEATGWDEVHSDEIASVLVIGVPPNAPSAADVNAGQLSANSGVIRNGLQVGGNIGVTGNLLFLNNEGESITVGGDVFADLVNGTLNYMPLNPENISVNSLTTSLLNFQGSPQEVTFDQLTFSPNTPAAVVTVGSGLQVDGETVLNGNVIISSPQGDISMGHFGSDNN